MPNPLMRWLLRLIALITVLSGLVQIVSPALVLGFIGATVTPASMHFFGLVGMFMALFGGMLFSALQRQSPAPFPVFWAGMQKVGAVAGVVLGVSKGVFAPLALGVALFDLASAILILYYYAMLKYGSRRFIYSSR